MKALVLAGGFPQISLIQSLQKRGIEVILADYYEHPIARDYADVFYRVSTLDVEAIKNLAIKEHVDFLITVCTDQALLTVAKVSEELGLPTYIDYKTALNVTNKSYMKEVFWKAGIPTSKYRIVENDAEDFAGWEYPLIVKPVDCNSSKGVKKVFGKAELKRAMNDAIEYSRTNTAIVEEFVEGIELSVDVYVEDGIAHVLDITTSEKMKDSDKFVIFRSWHPISISQRIKNLIDDCAQKIADAFGIKDAPMLIQLIASAGGISVLEFSARTGGGTKFLSIERQSGVNVIEAVIDLCMGNKPHIKISEPKYKYMLDEYIYCCPGEYDHAEGFNELKNSGELLDYYVFKWKGAVFDKIENSGDRIAGFTIVANSLEELRQRHLAVNGGTKIVSVEGKDIMRHDLLTDFDSELTYTD